MANTRCRVAALLLAAGLPAGSAGAQEKLTERTFKLAPGAKPTFTYTRAGASGR